ncbi:MAG: SIMPL domain-containing protein [Steroidobacteraceae bacterium]|nr:SIMPL domain-containing protein [Steroidobacteraceae bacterium]
MPMPTRRIHRQSGATTLGSLLLGLTLAVGLVVAAMVVGGSLERIKLAGDKITVKGYAEEKVVSDAGTWRATVTVRATDLQSGYRALEADTERVLAMLTSVAGESASAAIAPISARPRYEIGPGGVQTGRVVGYELDRTFELSSADVALIGKVAAQASALISEGVNINSWPPQYFYNDLNAVKVRLIGAATRDAQLRAEQFASGSGVTVGALRSASQGVFQITRPNSTETADYGSYDTGTVEKIVKAVVTVEYAVARE